MGPVWPAAHIHQEFTKALPPGLNAFKGNKQSKKQKDEA